MERRGGQRSIPFGLRRQPRPRQQHPQRPAGQPARAGWLLAESSVRCAHRRPQASVTVPFSMSSAPPLLMEKFSRWMSRTAGPPGRAGFDDVRLAVLRAGLAKSSGWRRKHLLGLLERSLTHPYAAPPQSSCPPERAWPPLGAPCSRQERRGSAGDRRAGREGSGQMVQGGRWRAAHVHGAGRARQQAAKACAKTRRQTTHLKAAICCFSCFSCSRLILSASFSAPPQRAQREGTA